MYDNAGSKIKRVSKIFGYVGIAASIIGGIAVIANDEDMIPIGLLVIVAGSFVSWFSSLLFYGFGELIVSVSHIEGYSFSSFKKTSHHASEPLYSPKEVHYVSREVQSDENKVDNFSQEVLQDEDFDFSPSDNVSDLSAKKIREIKRLTIAYQRNEISEKEYKKRKIEIMSKL